MAITGLVLIGGQGVTPIPQHLCGLAVTQRRANQIAGERLSVC